MAEPPRDPELHAPENPPQSVLREPVRRTALRAYLGPIVLFFAVVGIALIYWSTRPPGSEPRQDDSPRAEGTVGSQPSDTPGGFEPRPEPDSTRDEIEARGGEIITELTAVLDDRRQRSVIGRRVELRNLEVERVESPALFWVRDGEARVAIVPPAGTSALDPGRRVNVNGVVERAGEGVRIKASVIQIGGMSGR